MARFYIDKYTATVEQTDKYLVRVIKKDGTVLEDLEPRRLFPLSKADMFITLLDQNEKETAFVRDLAETDEATQKALLACFKEHYRIPRICAIHTAEEKLGMLTFTVDTDLGSTKFMIRNRHSDIKSNKNGRVLIRDTNDNRYEVPDWHTLDAHSRHVLFSYL